MRARRSPETLLWAQALFAAFVARERASRASRTAALVFEIRDERENKCKYRNMGLLWPLLTSFFRLIERHSADVDILCHVNEGYI